MATLTEQDEYWVLKLSKKAFGKDFLMRLLEFIELEAIAQRNQMSESDAWEISEDIKTDWWEANRDRIMAKIQPHLQ